MLHLWSTVWKEDCAFAYNIKCYIHEPKLTRQGCGLRLAVGGIALWCVYKQAWLSPGADRGTHTHNHPTASATVSPALLIHGWRDKDVG